MQKVPYPYINFPRDADAEADLLGLCLLGGRPPETSPNLFFDVKNRDVAEAMQCLTAEGSAINAGSVLGKLKDSKAAPRWNGQGYVHLAELLERVPAYSESQERHYSERVRKAAALRALIELAADTMQAAQEPGADPAEIAAQIQQGALEVEAPQSSLVTVTDVLKPLLKEIGESIENDNPVRGVTTGLASLNRATTGLGPGELWIIAGRPGQGKSALAWTMALKAAESGSTVLGLSLEMGAKELTKRLLSQKAHVSYTAIQRGGPSLADHYRYICQAADKLKGLPIHLERKPRINEIDLQRLVGKVKPDLVLIDYLQLMRPAGRHPSREAEVSHLTRSLKILAMDRGIPLVALSQLNRDMKGRNDPKPRLTDLRESGAIEQDADVVIGLYRPDEAECQADLCLLKNRNGKTGTFPVWWHGPTMRYHDITEGGVV